MRQDGMTPDESTRGGSPTIDVSISNEGAYPYGRCPAVPRFPPSRSPPGHRRGGAHAPARGLQRR
ncbi:hypothetical protein ACFFX0_15980 [Citricoccus parietis]|uniref:Uncharacterized protein n=1 Tax=Citricoccus parietis TaxID=592307 RepID=A0ABV5G105_9MICC